MLIGCLLIISALMATDALVSSSCQAIKHRINIRTTMPTYESFRSIFNGLGMTRRLYEGEEITGKSLILCGPSGAGKGSIIDELMKREPDHYELCVSHTSRRPRSGEVNGTHYYFVSKESMTEEIKMDEEYSTGESSALKYKFLEYAEVHGNLYGTSVESVRNIHNNKHVAILDVDAIGVQGIHELNILPAKYVFVAPPSLQELEIRLRKRNTETEEQIDIRLQNAVAQLEFGINSSIFDYILENDDLDKAVDELSERLREWKISP